MHRFHFAAVVLVLIIFAYTASAQTVSVLPAGMNFVGIPAGSFVMGSPENELGRGLDEGPQYFVYFDSFEMMTTEVTQAMWEEVTGTTINDLDDGNVFWRMQGEGADYPVYMVSWDNCQSFIARLNYLDREYTYSLPTEAQWEYACRAGTTTRHFWGEDSDQVEIDTYAWFFGNSENQVHSVGQKSPNSWGLYDMCGNVREWCEDVYAGSYHSHPQDGTSFDGLGVGRIIRGGGQNSRQNECRSAGRLRNPVNPTGFRLVRVKQGHSSVLHPWYENLIIRFEIDTDGVITDLETDMQWLVSSEEQISLIEAEEWAESLGIGWRIPSRAELYSLYEGGIGFGNWDILENDGSRVWSLEDGEQPSHWYCIFQGDLEYWVYNPDGHPKQAFAVRDLSSSTVRNDTPFEQPVVLPTGMKFTTIPEGSFVMGSSESEQGRSDSEDSQHTVHVNSFEFMTTPVTQGMWDEVIGGIPNSGRGVGFNFPVYDLWCGSAKAFAEHMNALDPAHEYRLPSEAEWEYACRAGTTTRFYWGDDLENIDIDLYAWYQGNSDTRTHPVGAKLPNNWGLFDMSGSVNEWCQDSLPDNYEELLREGGFSSDGIHLFRLRGGTFSWGADYCRSASRPNQADRSNGFRLVRTSVTGETETVPVQYSFNKDSEGIIIDFSTGLEWLVHPAHHISWENARGWAYSLGEGWRIPTPQELRGLYETSTALYGNLGSGWGIWSEDEFDSGSVSCMRMSDGEEIKSHLEYLPFEARAFAVRISESDRFFSITDGLISVLDVLQTRFVKDSDGNITDSQTGLVWRTGPARDCSMVDASRFLLELGAGWRFPTIGELEILHEAGIYWPGNMGPFEIRGVFNKGFWIWSGDQVGESHHRGRFLYGFTIFGGKDSRSYSSENESEFVRIFAVRSSTEDAALIPVPDEIDHTSKKTRWKTGPTKCSVTWVVLDSDWEAEFCRIAESHDRVTRYIKNQGLGLEVPYRFGSINRSYIPDFIVRVDDGRGQDDLLNLMVEIKGFRREDAKDKKLTMESYWVPGVNNHGTFGRWDFVELTDIYDMQGDFEKLVECKLASSSKS